jgi:hypothetical protein
LGNRRDLRRCRTRCRHCRIFFLTHPRNGGRRDLDCPFGCRAAHRRKCSAERSKAYYRTEAGKEKKALLNGRRRQARNRGAEREGASGKDESEAAEPEAVEFDAEIVEHVRVVTSLIEGFEVSREEVVAMLERTMRQRRIARERRVDYVLRWLADHFP